MDNETIESEILRLSSEADSAAWELGRLLGTEKGKAALKKLKEETPWDFDILGSSLEIAKDGIQIATDIYDEEA